MHVYVPNLFRTFTRRSLQQMLSEHRHWAISQTTSPHNFADTRHSWRDGGIVSRRCQISVTGSHLVSLIEMVSTDLSSFNQSVSPIIVYRLYVLFRPHAVMWLVSAMSGASQRPQLRGGAQSLNGAANEWIFELYFLNLPYSATLPRQAAGESMRKNRKFTKHGTVVNLMQLVQQPFTFFFALGEGGCTNAPSSSSWMSGRSQNVANEVRRCEALFSSPYPIPCAQPHEFFIDILSRNCTFLCTAGRFCCRMHKPS